MALILLSTEYTGCPYQICNFPKHSCKVHRSLDQGYKCLTWVSDVRSLELFKIEICAHKVLNKPVEIQVGGGSVVNREISPLVEVTPESDRFF